MRPTIGITSSFGLDKTGARPHEQAYLPAAYSDAVVAGGSVPHVLPVLAEADHALMDDLLASVDGVLFTGGWDLPPALYGQAPHATTEPMHARRAAFEVEFFRRADAAGVPIFAICLGFQVAHVARGGQLVQHVDDLHLTPAVTHHMPDHSSAYHRVRIAGDSRLAAVVGSTDIEANSRHHQGVTTEHQGRGLRPVAYAPDGLLEASEDCDGRFLLAVQWHPENLIDRPEHLKLFQALAAAAGRA